MHPNGPPRLFIDPPYFQNNQQSATSPAGPYFSSPATYSPLPFTQQPSNFAHSVQPGAVQGFFPGGRQVAVSNEYAAMNGGTMMGLGPSQMSETPSMLRSSSSSSYSSTSSFVPSTPLNAPYFSPPIPQTSPLLFSPPLPSFPSSFSAHSTPSARNAPTLRDKAHSRSPSFQSPSASDSGSQRRRGNASISIQRSQETPQRSRPTRHAPRDSVSIPLGVGTRPDEEVKKRKKIVVRLPREGGNGVPLEAEEENNEHDSEGERQSIRTMRSPLSTDVKMRKMEQMERDLAQVVMLEEDELVGKPPHFDEIKNPGLPPTIDVYLPGLSGWEVAWDEFGQDSLRRFGSFKTERPAFLQAPASSTHSRSLASSVASPSPTSPRPPISPVAPAPPSRSHTRTYSLFNSPVVLPARLQNVLDSLSRRHNSSMSISSSQPLDPAAPSFTSPSPSLPLTTQGITTKLTPFAPSFLPSWSTIKAKAQGIPLPESDESMAEATEEEQEASRVRLVEKEEIGRLTEDAKEIKSSESGTASDPSRVLEEEAAISLLQKDAETEEKSFDDATKLARSGEEEEETVRNEPSQSRRTSAVSTRTDQTGVASISDGFLEREEIDQEAVQGDSTRRGESPQSLKSTSLPGLPSVHNSPASRIPESLLPLPPSIDGSDDGSEADVEARTSENPAFLASPTRALSNEFPEVCTSDHYSDPEADLVAEEETGGSHRINRSFEFPARSPQKPRPSSPLLPLVRDSPRPSCSSSPSRAPDESAELEKSRKTFGELSCELSPSLFGINGGPGSISASSPSSSPMPGKATFYDQNASTPPPQSSPSLDQHSRPHNAPRYPLPPTRASIVCPIPRRPYTDLQATFDNDDLNHESSIPPRSFDSQLPANTPVLPSSIVEQAPTPRQISHGPLPPLPLVQVEKNNKRQKVEFDEEASLSSNSHLAGGSRSTGSLEDAIPPQYVYQFVSSSQRHLAAISRGRQDSEDIALPSSSRPKHRALPVPPFEDKMSSNQQIAKVSGSDYREAASVFDNGSLQYNRSAASDENNSVEDNDTPLRILERIIDRQFDGLRSELKDMNAQSNSLPSPHAQDVLVNTLTTRIQKLLSTKSSPDRPSLEASQGTPAFASSHEKFLKDLHSTISPLVQAPLDVDQLVSKLVSKLNFEQSATSQLTGASSKVLSDTLVTVTQSRNETAALLEQLSSKVSTLLEDQGQLAQTLTLSQDAASTLKDAMAQLGLDVTSRLDSAYSALEQRLASDSSSQFVANIATLESQLSQVREERDKILAEKTISIERLEADLAHAKAEVEALKNEVIVAKEEKRNEEKARIEVEHNLNLAKVELNVLREQIEHMRDEEGDMRQELQFEKVEIETFANKAKAELNKANGEILALERRLATQDKLLKAALLDSAMPEQMNFRKLEASSSGLVESRLQVADSSLQEKLDSAESEKQKLVAENLDYQKRFQQIEEELISVKNTVTRELNEAKDRIGKLTHDRDQLREENQRFVELDIQQRPSYSPSRYSPEPFDSPQDLPSTPPATRFLSNAWSTRASIPSKLLPQNTGQSDDSDDTVAHTNFSPTPSVASRFSVSEEGWYSAA
ncbi:hypothetical protein JCM3765_002532 [Sporobolomyces pararoseus]